MKTQTDEEIELQQEVETGMDNLGTVIGQMQRSKVAYIILKQFMELEDPSEELKVKFYSWLLSSEHAAAKDRAIQRCFEEMLRLD